MMSQMHSEILELKNMVGKQSDKIRQLERCHIDSTANSKNEALILRIDQFEQDQQNIMKHVSASTRDISETQMLAKSLYNRTQVLDDLIQSAMHEYVSKSSFSQLLDTCLDQMKGISTVVENSKTLSLNTQQNMDMLMFALSEMQSGDQPAYRLEYLSSLSG